jgi:DNA-binding transcriptional LysR family regulator
METRQLKYFLAVAEELNLGRAAQRLHISQPPLTRQIQQLEEQLGAQLFLRTPKGMELTEAGRLFREDAANILALMQRATERSHLAESGHLGRIDIGIFGSALFNVIPRLLLMFRSRYPKVEISLHNLNKNEQIEALRDKRLTLGFNRLIPEHGDLQVEQVRVEPVLIAVNQGHALAAKEELSLADIAGEPLIVYPNHSRPNFADEVISLYYSESLQPNVAQEVEDVVTAIALVSGGFGLALVPASAANLQLPHVVYRALRKTPCPTVDLSCVYRKDDASPLLRAFLEIIRSHRDADGIIDTPTSASGR